MGIIVIFIFLTCMLMILSFIFFIFLIWVFSLAMSNTFILGICETRNKTIILIRINQFYHLCLDFFMHIFV